MADDKTYQNAEARAYMLAEEMEKAQLTNKEIREIFFEVGGSRTTKRAVLADDLPEIEEPE